MDFLRVLAARTQNQEVIGAMLPLKARAFCRLAARCSWLVAESLQSLSPIHIAIHSVCLRSSPLKDT